MTDYEKLKHKLVKMADLQHILAVLGWDREVNMPPKGGAFRAQQAATLSGMIHNLATAPELGELLEKLKDDTTLDAVQAKNVALASEDYLKSQKYSEAFVVELSQTISQTNEAWAKARTASDFSLYAPSLKKLVELKRQECELLGYEEHPYDAMIDQYEPGTKTAEVTELFDGVREQLVAFVEEINQAQQVDNAFLTQHFPREDQWNFSLELLKQMHYDFEAGRQDISLHPFSTSFSPLDVRVTTRINENNLAEMIWSCIHEGGHALYEQGLPVEQYGMPVGSYVSLGVHESQSRLWENNVGRSLAYWQHNLEKAKSHFPGQLDGIDVEEFYRAANKVEPSLIRTSADELTYHFHVMIRFEIEKALIAGEIEVEELPALWNEKYKAYLGIDVPNDAVGILQDVHWSHGSIGYFPTYSIGSFYAAQYYHHAKAEIGDLDGLIVKGEMKPLLDWLRKHIHQPGKFHTAKELCEKVTGEPLNFNYFMEYAREKYSNIYALASETSA